MTGQRQAAKERTRARISDVATALFLQRGFDEVTVADVAAAAGVSRVTVFAHFTRKEDLLLDLAPEAARLLRQTLTDRPTGMHPVQALRELAVRLAVEEHPLAGLSRGTRPFLRTVADSPALVARAYEQLDDLEHTLAGLLAQDDDKVPDPALLAALVLAGYRTVVADSARRLLAGAEQAEVAADHLARLQVVFDVLAAAAGVVQR